MLRLLKNLHVHGILDCKKKIKTALKNSNPRIQAHSYTSHHNNHPIRDLRPSRTTNTRTSSTFTHPPLYSLKFSKHAALPPRFRRLPLTQRQRESNETRSRYVRPFHSSAYRAPRFPMAIYKPKSNSRSCERTSTPILVS